MALRPSRFEDLRPDPDLRLEEIKAHRNPIALLLDRIEDPRNAGALFRLADAARCAHVYGFRTGNLPALRKVQRVARSTQKYVPFTELKQLEAVKDLAASHQLIGLDITPKSIPYSAFQPEGPLLLLIGNERQGLDPALLALTEACVHVPMHGMNTSMNVAVATGIALYGLLDKLV